MQRVYVALLGEVLATFDARVVAAASAADATLLGTMHLDLAPLLALSSDSSANSRARKLEEEAEVAAAEEGADAERGAEPPAKKGKRSAAAHGGLNFFTDIVHIQAHRRARALTRLHQALARTSGAPDAGGTPGPALALAPGSTRHVMLPIVLHCVVENADIETTKTSSGNGYGQDQGQRSFTDSTSVRVEALPVLRALAQRLSWSLWQVLLRRLQTALGRISSKEGPDSLLERSLIRAVCHVAEAWHFDLRNKTIMRALQRRIIPSLQKLVVKGNDKKTSGLSGSGQTREIKAGRDGGRKGGKGLRIKMVHAITTLVLHMKSDRRAQERILKSLLGDVCNMLRSKAQSIRDDARTTLAHVATSVGIRSLPLILHNLGHVLTKSKQRNRFSRGTAGGGSGFDRHVLSHSTFSVLEALEVCGALDSPAAQGAGFSSRRLSVRSSSSSSGGGGGGTSSLSGDAMELDVVVVDGVGAGAEPAEAAAAEAEAEQTLVDDTPLFKAIPFLIELVMKDIFGAAAKERARGQANEYKSKHGKIREMGSSKGLDIFELVCRHIKFEPEDALAMLVEPLTHQGELSLCTVTLYANLAHNLTRSP